MVVNFVNVGAERTALENKKTVDMPDRSIQVGVVQRQRSSRSATYSNLPSSTIELGTGTTLAITGVQAKNTIANASSSTKLLTRFSPPGCLSLNFTKDLIMSHLPCGLAYFIDFLHLIAEVLRTHLHQRGEQLI